ncbi:MAG: hypothetical protein IT178_09390 [Acidobacteria bacterium]|nr:hypothetical protein [Acidobacteriota bacterium]
MAEQKTLHEAFISEWRETDDAEQPSLSAWPRLAADGIDQRAVDGAGADDDDDEDEEDDEDSDEDEDEEADEDSDEDDDEDEDDDAEEDDEDEGDVSAGEKPRTRKGRAGDASAAMFVNTGH